MICGENLISHKERQSLLGIATLLDDWTETY